MTNTPPSKNDSSMWIVAVVVVIVVIVLALVFSNMNTPNPSVPATDNPNISSTQDSPLGATDLNDEMTEVEQTMPSGSSVTPEGTEAP